MHTKSVEFEARVGDDGTIRLPVPVVDLLGIQPGTKLQVRVSSTELSAALNGRQVTEEEIGRIAALQLEPREQVVKFVLSEGAAGKNSPFRLRLKKAGTGN
ncbi:MAG: AbrB/MazE/SpoVT family DNA-binding domain-containing protein [Bacteroidota bacterium]